MKKEYVIDIDQGHIQIECTSYWLFYSEDGQVHEKSGSVLCGKDPPTVEELPKVTWLDKKLLEED